MPDPIFYIKQGDDTPTLDVQLQDEAGFPIDVTGATIVFYMRNKSTAAVKINGSAATILTGVRGEVRYSFSTSDTDTAAEYEAEFQVTFSGGTVGTFPNDGYITVQILDDIG
jgi:hypothetical protein